MTTLSREKLINRPFADKKHYPYGFARSGDFSISESKLLQAHGSLFAALVAVSYTHLTLPTILLV